MADDQTPKTLVPNIKPVDTKHIESDPAFNAMLNAGDAGDLYMVEIKNKKDGRIVVTGAGMGFKNDDKRARRLIDHTYHKGWEIVKVCRATEAQLQARANEVEKTQSHLIPLDELTDGTPSAVITDADLANADTA